MRFQYSHFISDRYPNKLTSIFLFGHPHLDKKTEVEPRNHFKNGLPAKVYGGGGTEKPNE
jgi:hypothetical protein